MCVFDKTCVKYMPRLYYCQLIMTEEH
jgi:hypothetical protein